MARLIQVYSTTNKLSHSNSQLVGYHDAAWYYYEKYVKAQLISCPSAQNYLKQVNKNRKKFYNLQTGDRFEDQVIYIPFI